MDNTDRLLIDNALNLIVFAPYRIINLNVPMWVVQYKTIRFSAVVNKKTTTLQVNQEAETNTHNHTIKILKNQSIE